MLVDFGEQQRGCGCLCCRRKNVHIRLGMRKCIDFCLLFCVSGLFLLNEYWVHVGMQFDHGAQQAELLCWVSGLCVCVCVHSGGFVVQTRCAHTRTVARGIRLSSRFPSFLVTGDS